MADKKRKRKSKPKPFVVSVRDFGAVGDGKTDDSQAFRSAVRSRATEIVIPPGFFVVEGSVAVDPRFVSRKEKSLRRKR